MEHRDAYELIEGFVFGTLSEEETAQVEIHLDSGCAECLARMREVGEVSVNLATALPPSEVPSALKEKTLARAFTGQRTSEPPSAEQHPAGSILKLVAFSGIAASLALLFWGLSLKDELQTANNELQNVQQSVVRLQQDSAVYADAVELLGRPCTRLLDMKGIEPNPNAFANVMVHPEVDYAVAYVYRMPQPPEDMEYQLWVTREGVTRSVGVFSVNSSGEAVLKLESMENAVTIDSFLVTVEPRGGVQSPSGMSYLSGKNVLIPMH